MSSDDYTPTSNYHGGEKRQSCYFCECGPPLREHHIIPQRFNGPDSKGDIVEVCDLCHKRLERLYDKSFYEWFGIEDEKGKRLFQRPCESRDCTSRSEVIIRLGPNSHSTKYVCSRHAAKRARWYYNQQIGTYYKKLERYKARRSRIHDAARRHREKEAPGVSKWATNNGKRLEKPTPPQEPEIILARMVVEKSSEASI